MSNSAKEHASVAPSVTQDAAKITTNAILSGKLTNKGEAALALARQGFKVFPVKEGTKAPPLVLGWQLAATDDEARVRRWWTEFPTANVGLHCGDLIVLDVDPRKGGNESLVAFEIDHELPETLEVGTPSGGLHIYYKSDVAVPNGVNVYGEGIDVRSNGGYVLAPGSVVDGKRYTVKHDRPIADAPAFLKTRTAQQKPNKSAQTSGPDPSWRTCDQKTNADDVAAALDARKPTPEGARNTTLASVIVGFCWDHGLHLDTALTVIREHWRYVGSFDDAELERTVRSRYRSGFENDFGGNSREAIAEGFADERTPDEKTADELKPAYKRRTLHPSQVTLGAVLSTEHDLVEGMLYRNSIACLFGKWQTGKTFLTLAIGLHVAAGKTWGRWDVEQGGVLIFSYEGDIGLSKRLWSLREYYADVTWDRIPFEIELMTDPIISKDGRAQADAALHDFARRYGRFPALIIVDPLRDALGGSDSDPELTGPYIRYARQVRTETKCCFLTVHHPGHGDQNRGRGDSALVAAWDTELHADGEIIHVTKQRDDAKQEFGYTLKTLTLGNTAKGKTVTSCVAIYRDPLAGAVEGNQRTLLEAALSVATDGRVTRKEAIAASGLPKVAVDTAWRALRRRGLLIPSGRAYVFGASPFGSAIDPDRSAASYFDLAAGSV